MRDAVIKTFARVMGLDAATLSGDETPESVESWDSFKHMNLVLALEEDFGVLLDDDDVVAMVCLDEVVRIVSKRRKRACKAV